MPPEEFVESVPHYVAVRFFWSGKRGETGFKDFESGLTRPKKDEAERLFLKFF